VILHPKAAADAPVNDGAALNFTTASGIDTTSFGSSRIYLPAGDVTLTASLGLGQITETLSLTPGQLLEKDVIIGTGLAVVDGYYTEGMIMDTTQHSVEILAAKKALDGSRASLTTSYGPGQKFDLPPGEYVAIVSQGAASAEVPFSVKTGERVDVTVILNAGVLAVTAPGANEIEVFEAKADINGNRKQVGFDYATEQSFTLPEGDYLITAKQGEAQIEGPANVKKGERTEITLTLP
jgi:Ca-activated chloride channel family protein